MTATSNARDVENLAMLSASESYFLAAPFHKPLRRVVKREVGRRFVTLVLDCGHGLLLERHEDTGDTRVCVWCTPEVEP